MSSYLPITEVKLTESRPAVSRAFGDRTHSFQSHAPF